MRYIHSMALLVITITAAIPATGGTLIGSWCDNKNSIYTDFNSVRTLYDRSGIYYMEIQFKDGSVANQRLEKKSDREFIIQAE